MTRVQWPALLRFGLVELRLSPEAFWQLTPAELTLMAGQGGGAVMSRAGLDALIQKFPDKQTTDEVPDGGS